MHGPILAVGTHAEAVHADVVCEGLADAVCIPVVGERPGQEFLQLHVELGEGGPDIPEPTFMAEPQRELRRMERQDLLDREE